MPVLFQYWKRIKNQYFITKKKNTFMVVSVPYDRDRDTKQDKML